MSKMTPVSAGWKGYFLRWGKCRRDLFACGVYVEKTDNLVLDVLSL